LPPPDHAGGIGSRIASAPLFPAGEAFWNLIQNVQTDGTLPAVLNSSAWLCYKHAMIGAPGPNSLEQHYTTVIKALVDGRVVPFLGAGVNRCDRPEAVTWQPNQAKYLPDGGELSRYLKASFGGPPGESNDLARVSQYISVMNGEGPLYDELHKVFDANYPPTRLHIFLASLRSRLTAKGYPRRNSLVVTTNYDDVMERALQAQQEEYDLVTYIAEGKHRGRFLHQAPHEEPTVIEVPNEYRGLSLDRRAVILKIHGAVDRANSESDSFVITEDHYIDYLTRTDVSGLVPASIAAKMKRSNFLFLGYGLKDWNLRVILHRISNAQERSYASWAILMNPDELDRRFWMRRDVEIIDSRLEEYIAALSARVDALPSCKPPVEAAHA
jgi:SIR2-like domain